MFSTFFFLLNLSFVYAAPVTEQLMQAKDVNEIKSVIHNSEAEHLYYERCQSELRGPYLPTHCYLWLSKKSMPGEERKLLIKTFDVACEQRLAQDIEVGDKNLKYTDQLSPICKKSLKAWLKVKLYKLHRENASQLLSKLESGRVFVSRSPYANQKSVSQNRVHSARAPRVRFN